jgi:hypothetical protein
MKKISSSGSFLLMGVVWLALALFGLIFDPGKNVILISQITAGAICLAVYLYLKLKKF